MSSSEIDPKKPALVSDSSNPESLFYTKTPTRIVKRHIVSSPQSPEIVVNLPERFEILELFFNGLDTAIRLLKLKGSLTSFANICPKIEFLTNRIFSYDHLARLKHIYPEAIELKRVLKYVEGTCCMKPSLHINLNTDAIVLDNTTCGTKYMELRKVFYSKLVDFYKTHPKDEIPKEMLPEPFNSPNRDSYSDTISVDLRESKLVEFDAHMEEVEQEDHIVNEIVPDSTSKECLLSEIESKIVGTPVKELSTPSKDLSTPIRLMSATPTLQLSRRCIELTPEDGDDNSVRSKSGLAKGPSRSLNFDTLEEDAIVNYDIGNNSVDEADDVSDEVSFLQSSQMNEKPKTETKKHNLPKLVDLIHMLFHSTKRTVITKEELLHKITVGQIDITDRREVEEQLSLMLQLVPDWISETKASSGDNLVRINQMSAAETVRAKLEEATSQGISAVN